MANDVKYKMSRARLNELVEELRFMETVRAKEVADLIKEARSFGDLSENSEYDEAKTEQGKLYSKIAELRNLIENSEVVEKIEATGIVVFGSKATLALEDGEEETYMIVGSQEANPMEGMISDDSPIGRMLLGKTVGDSVSVEVPAGILNFVIKSIEN